MLNLSIPTYDMNMMSMKISRKTEMTLVTLTLTLRSSGYVDLVYTYVRYEYDEDQRSLRLSKAIFNV